MMRILFVGETWQGSSARSLREALVHGPTVTSCDIGEDTFLPHYRHLPMRVANRVLRGFQRRELRSAVLESLRECSPDVVVVYKGTGVNGALVSEIRSGGTPVVNVFPDCSPHAHGRQLQDALGRYSLVISTKPFHPSLWRLEYGYENRCVCVPHGYDPALHYWSTPSTSQIYDVGLCGSWRPEYHRLMVSFAEALGSDVSVAVAGSGWSEHRHELPNHWVYAGPKPGRSYGEFLRATRIAIAPVSRLVVVRGVQQHGEEDTTRTYELAAAHCFFVHQRSDYLATVYDEATEVPLWDDVPSLVGLVRRWLPDETGRCEMAGRAHARAVPAYSIPQRALSVLRHIEMLIKEQGLS